MWAVNFVLACENCSLLSAPVSTLHFSTAPCLSRRVFWHASLLHAHCIPQYACLCSKSGGGGGRKFNILCVNIASATQTIRVNEKNGLCLEEPPCSTLRNCFTRQTDILICMLHSWWSRPVVISLCWRTTRWNFSSTSYRQSFWFIIQAV
jgi:hypothetical protein